MDEQNLIAYKNVECPVRFRNFFFLLYLRVMRIGRAGLDLIAFH